MWYNLVKDFRYITVNSLLKKLKNILNIQGKKSAVLVTVFMILFVVVAPVFVNPSEINAQAPRGTECKITSGSQIVMDIAADRTIVKADETFTVQVSLTFKTTNEDGTVNQPVLDIAKACELNGKSNYSFQFYPYDSSQSTLSSGINAVGTFFTETASGVKEYGYAARMTGVSLANMGAGVMDQGVKTQPDGDYFLYAYLKDRDRGKIDNIYIPPKPGLKITQSTSASEVPKKLPDLQKGVSPIQYGTSSADKDTVPFDELFFKVNIKSAKKDKFRNFYRIVPGSKLITVPENPAGGRTDRKNKVISFAEFDRLGGIPISLGLDEKTSTDSLRIGSNGTSISYSRVSKNYPNLAYFLGATHRANQFLLVSLESTLQKNKDICAISVFSSTQYTCDKNSIKETPATFTLLSKSQMTDLPMNLGSGKSLDAIGIKGSNEAILTLNVLPTINVQADWTQWLIQTSTIFVTNPITINNGFSPAGFSYAREPVQKVYFQIYSSPEELEKHKDDPIPNTVPEYKDVVTGNTESSGPEGPAQSLYAFIVRVISVVITWLQTIIYAAFAYILVPVLNALLKVRPYKDTFVNIIYPGWLILRNLANIFFIVSLLVVGLKILFQQSAASTAKNFILRLVLMALLVNFSLVISQGIVGIADTVQSQFLPADSKIIEALGSKLMVEPLKNFRDQVAGANDTFSTDDAEGSIADTVKPLVLLMLSLASFFSFAALAAFLLVRLVVLWVLYMTSPVAYVGYVMEETQTYAKQWWKEFLKYVIMTPVLVFFLNIAALMATLFSGQDNSIFEFSEGIAGDIVAATMTIISHFIVLFFIYVGMKFALSSGTIGAKTIVDYAKKGFDTFTSKPAKEAAQTQWDRRFKGGMLDPKAHIGAFKEQVDKTTKTKMEKRLGGKANKLTPEGLYSNPKRALKYVLGGASAGTEGFQNEINAKRDEAAILTEAERRDLTTNAALNTVSLNTARRQMEAMEDGKLENSMAQEKIATELDNEIRRLGDAKRDEVAELTRRGRTTEAGILARDYDARIADLTAVKTDIDNAILASTDGNIVLDAETKDKVSVVFDADDVKAELKDEITDLESKANALTNDAERRNKYGYGVAGTNGAREIDFNRQMQLKNEAEKLEEQMNDHAMPVSLGARNARLTRESEAAKKIAHLEGEELRYAFKKAMADNNMDLAAAIAKKAAQEGDADMLLKEHGFKNNIEDFHKFINQKFASFGPSVRAQIGSEISALADKNGNAAIGKAYRVNNSGQLVGRSMQEQAKKVNTSIAKSPPEDVFKKKPTEISRQIGSNQHELYEGIVTNLNTMNKEKLKNMVRRMPAKTAKFILNASNKNLLSLDVKLALEKTANKS